MHQPKAERPPKLLRDEEVTVEARRMTDDTPLCLACSQDLEFNGMLRSKREDDGRQTCRSLWSGAERHLWMA